MAYSVRYLHRCLGWLLCLPMLVWAATGFVFLTKPGYQGAFDQISIERYALTHEDIAKAATFNPLAAKPDYSGSGSSTQKAVLVNEVKLVKSALGLSILTRDSAGVAHWQLTQNGNWFRALSPLQNQDTRNELLTERQGVATTAMGEDLLSRLMQDIQAVWPERYGIEGNWQGPMYITDTGVRLTLDWNTLTVQQTGADTQWINRLYRWHYLQWTGVDVIDRILGVVGLLGLVGLTVLGVRMLLR